MNPKMDPDPSKIKVMVRELEREPLEPTAPSTSSTTDRQPSEDARQVIRAALTKALAEP